MDSLLILNSSILVQKPFLLFDDIKIEYGKNRIDSYKYGFDALANLNIYDYFNSVVLIDNTIKSLERTKENKGQFGTNSESI